MKIFAVVLGIIVDLVCSVLLAIPLHIFGILDYLGNGGSLDTYETYLYSSLPLMLTGIFLGSSAVILGGGITAYVAKEHRMRNAFFMGFFLLFIMIPISRNLPLWFNVVSFAITVPCALLGGWMVEKLLKRQQRQGSPSCDQQSRRTGVVD